MIPTVATVPIPISWGVVCRFLFFTDAPDWDAWLSLPMDIFPSLK